MDRLLNDQRAAGNALFNDQGSLVPILNDTQAPILPGTLNITSITSAGFTVSWQAASDDIGVSGYELSVDKGVAAYSSYGDVQTAAVGGLSPNTQYTVRVRAYDEAGNKSTALTALASTTGSAPIGNSIESVRKTSDSVTMSQLSTLSSAATQISYKAGTNQELVLFNNSTSAVVVTLKGSAAGPVTTKGLAGVTVDLSGGLPITVPAKQFVLLKLDNAILYLKGAVTLTAAVNGVVSAGILQ